MNRFGKEIARLLGETGRISQSQPIWNLQVMQRKQLLNQKSRSLKQLKLAALKQTGEDDEAVRPERSTDNYH